MKKLTFLVLTALAVSSCQQDDSDDPTPTPSNRVVNNNLSDRVTYYNEPLEPYGKTRTSGNNAQWVYVAEVTSPVVNGATLSATGIAFQGNRAYVSYHWNGTEGDFAGALEVIDVSNPAQPVIMSSLFFTDTDLNDLSVEGNKLYTTGGRSIYSFGYNSSLTNGGIVEVVELTGGGLLTTNTTQSWLPSFSGNSVFKKGEDLFVASGNTGGGAFRVSLKNNNYLGIVDSDYYDHSKFGVRENGKFIFLQGGPSAQIFIHNNDLFNPGGKTTISLSASTSPVDGKAVLYVDNTTAYVSAGTNGMHIFDLNSNTGIPTTVFNTAGNGFVNGVHADDNHVFVAKGHEGMYILNSAADSIQYLFDFNGSANYVRSNNQNVFIANGIGGLQILAKNNGLNYGNPYCTNQTVYEPYNGNMNGIVRLTAMGNYKENGQYGKRWRIRNETNQDRTVYWDLYGSTMTGSFTVPAMTAVHFTSHFRNHSGGGGTMRLFSDQARTNQIQVKAHGGSTKDLSTCN